MADDNKGLWVLLGTGVLGGLLAALIGRKDSNSTSVKGCSSCNKR